MARKTTNESKKLKNDQSKKGDQAKEPIPANNWMNTTCWILLASLFGYLHFKHNMGLFENEKHFSHLSNLERELSFRTESGLYYYYFKILVVNQNLVPVNDSLIGLINQKIINDDRTEYPATINSLKRFNLYPEIVLAFFYRIFNGLNMLSRQCWKVNRGDDMPAVSSCIGNQEPIYFYSTSVFVLHAFSMFFLFTLCWLINGRSLTAGIIGCVCYFFNHGESTRVMRTPALRESFSFPFHLLQLVSLTSFMLSKENDLRKTAFKQKLSLTLSTLIYLLPWQFSQFSLGTQTFALFATYSLGFISRSKLVSIVISQSIALVICFVLMFANRMLMTSFFASLLCSTWFVLAIENIIRFDDLKFNELAVWKKILVGIGRLLLLVSFMVALKHFILNVLFKHEDDSHIWDILKSKFSQKAHTFDTRLYTCAKEFDFLEESTLWQLTGTLLLPVSLFNLLFCLLRLLGKYFNLSNESTHANNKMREQNEDGVILYNIFQLIAFTIMAGLIMRLKLFWTPHLCVFASFLAHKGIYSITSRYTFIANKESFKIILTGLMLSMMAYNGVVNIREQYNIQGEFSDYNGEKLMTWIEKATKKNDAFAGSMPMMANVKLSTNRPIVNHPHYEDVELRDRIKTIYSHMYGYREVSELNRLLKNRYKAKYLVIEAHYCSGHPPGKPECALSEVVHLDSKKDTKIQACLSMIHEDDMAKKHFKKVFESQYISVHQVL